MTTAADPASRVALAIARLPGVGRRRLRALLEEEAVCRARSAADLAGALGRRGTDPRLRDLPLSVAARAWDDAGRLLETCERRGWLVWVRGGAGYPAELGRLADPPALLFAQGQAPSPSTPRIAVIGTREPTPWGEAAARACAVAAVRAGAVVVAGLAWGIDTAAHVAAVDAGGVTWATLPGALDVIYPSSNRGLAERIVAGGGLLISEYLPGTRPHATFFVERDRLQAALADAVVVVETGVTGGTMHTVRFARELTVPLVVTFPDGLDAAAADQARTLPVPQQGTWRLLQQGAARIGPPDVAHLVEASRRGGGLRQSSPAGTATQQGRLFS